MIVAAEKGKREGGAYIFRRRLDANGGVSHPAPMNSGRTRSGLLYYTERGSGSPLLLVHGLMITGEMFEPVLDHFATRHRVIVPDLRGHGRSRDLPGPYSATQLAADLQQLLDHLGIQSAAILGYSQGGTIAQQFALDAPQRCHHLVLACTYAFNMATAREQVEGRLAPPLLTLLGMRRFARLIASQGMKELDPKVVNRMTALIADQDRALMVTAWKEAMRFDSRLELARIQCPTLILAASRDMGVPLHHAKALHAGIRGSQLVIVDGASHALIWTHPDEFVRIVEGFLAGG